MKTITVITYDDEGNDIEHELPAMRVVCDDCDGEGYVLRDGMRYHAYTMEEFDYEFDEEMKSEYFKRGGIYDVVCPTCKGKNVVDVVDREACERNPEYAKILNELDDLEEDRRMMEAEYAAERRMGA
jgi:RecJ-like exonuclease